MLKKIAFLVLLAALVFSARPREALAQTNTTVTNVTDVPTLNLPTFLDVFTNIPMTTNFTEAKLGIDTGATIKNGLENFLKVAAYLNTNWIAGCEIQNASVSSVVDSASVLGGYRRAWANADVYALAIGRKNWSGAAGSAFQGGGGVGGSYIPLTGGVMPIVAEVFVLTSPTGNAVKQSPQVEFRVGTGLRF